MKLKFFGMLVCIIFITKLVATINVGAYEEKDENKEPFAFGEIIVVGVMDLINETEQYRDYEIHVAVILEDSIDILIGEEKSLRLYDPHGLFLDSVVIAFCDSWEVV
jgi:hypothetical protein